MKRMLCLLAALLTLTQGASAVASAAVSAAAYIVTDTLTGKILAERNADEPRRMASLTKVAAAMTALELLDLDETVTVSAAAAEIEGSRMGLRAGETVTVRTLLYGLLLESGNDAALALAERVGERRFVDGMNALARRLGMTDTHFDNPHGLDGDTHRSTARDLAVLAAAAMRDERIRAITSAREYRTGGYSLHNHNKLLWSLEGCEGVKTGFTKAAGRCLISSVMRGGRRVIAVTLDAPDDWNDHRTLQEAAFAGMTDRVWLAEGEIAAQLRVESGARSRIAVRAAGTLMMRLTDGEAERAELKLYLPAFVYAPLEAGGPAGRAEVKLDGCVIASVPLVYETDVGAKQPSAKGPARLRAALRRWLGG